MFRLQNWHYKEQIYHYNVFKRSYRGQDYEKKIESTNIWPIITKILFNFFVSDYKWTPHSRVNDTIPNKECVATDLIEL